MILLVLMSRKTEILIQISYLHFLKNLWRNVKATRLYFLFGIIFLALFQRDVPSDIIINLFGVLIAATIGVCLYAGGGTIPLLQAWLWDGMSIGSASAFMITSPETKIMNLSVVKIIPGMKWFIIYLAYVMVFSLVSGLIVNSII